MVKIKYCGSYTPWYHTDGASGFDLESTLDLTLENNQFKKIPTGICLDIPHEYEIQIRPRSGLAAKGISLLNGIGTIDSDYTKEIFVILINYSKNPYKINIGDRIAQCVLAKVERAYFIYDKNTKNLSERGGFGSTGN